MRRYSQWLRFHPISLMDQHGSRHQSVSSTFLMDASLDPLKRRFKQLNDALHERLLFSAAKTANSLSTVFEGRRYDLADKQKVIVDFEPNGEKSCAKASDRSTERLQEDLHEGVAAYLVVCGVIGQNVGLRGLSNTQRTRFVSIPDGFEELCERCFSESRIFSRVTFGESSSLKLIEKGTFRGSGLTCFCLPGSVSSIGGASFSECPLKDFVIRDGNCFFAVFDGLFLSKDQ